MVDTDQIREEELTPDDVLNRELAEPQSEPEWRDNWDENEETRPGENTRLEDGTLYWEHEGFEIALESYETTHWRVEITIPEPYGKYFPRAVDVKCLSVPEYGYVDEVAMAEYAPEAVTIVISENYQPIWEVNHFIDTLIEKHEGGEEFEAEMSEMLEVARENEQE